MRESTHLVLELQQIPEPLAEDVHPDFARGAMKRYETRCQPEGLLFSAWYHAEMGLNQQLDHDKATRDCYFETTEYLIKMLLDQEHCHQDTLLGALVLASYLPTLKKRAARRDNEKIGPLDCERVYSSLGAAVRYLRPLSIDEPPQWRMTEVSILALSARTRQPMFLLYPASPREEQSYIQHLNHDSYFFRDNSKIPLQQKLIPSDKVYDESITMLTLQPLLDRGLKATGVSINQPLASKVNHLLSLIVAETSGEELETSERKFLNIMSESIVAHYRDGTQDRNVA